MHFYDFYCLTTLLQYDIIKIIESLIILFGHFYLTYMLINFNFNFNVEYRYTIQKFSHFIVVRSNIQVDIRVCIPNSFVSVIGKK